MDEEPVVVIDDDNDVIIADDGYHSRTSSAVDTIVIDEDFGDGIIEIDDEHPETRQKDQPSMFIGGLECLCDRVYKENKYLKHFVMLCLSLEHTDSMLRVINRSLLSLYKVTTTEFKESNKLTRILKRAIQLVSYRPASKFSQIRWVCDEFKKHRARKRVKLTTLSTNIDNVSKSDHLQFGFHRNTWIERRKKKIVADIPIISLEDDDENYDNVNDILKTNDETPIANSNKENCAKDNTDSNVNNINVALGLIQSEDSLLVPQRDEGLEDLDKIADNVDRVQEIERIIEEKKRQIALLDALEVTTDSKHSPYIKSEKLKKEVVELYKELCQCVGDQPVRRRVVRLKVIEGHPVGPVRKLEEFLNSNIGSEGDPQFPDFNDVVDCVKQANVEDGLGWNNHVIQKEATSLFTQCGRALQQWRQKREWRHLVGLLKKEELDLDDPADHDAELLARLQDNKRIALAKESDILSRFETMQTSRPTPSINLSVDTNSKKDLSDINPALFNHNNGTQSISNYEGNEQETSDDGVEESASLATESKLVQIKAEPEDIPALLEQMGNNYTMSIDIDDPLLITEISDSEYESE